MLEKRLIFSTIVAGKSASFAYDALRRFLEPRGDRTPFQYIAHLMQTGELGQRLREARTGNYTKLERCLPELIKLDPATCTVEDLEAIHGIGPKTARFFVIWTRPDARYAALDVHILRWLREQGYDAPRHTPTGQKYRELEAVFLRLADERGLTPSQLDAEIWYRYNRQKVTREQENWVFSAI